MRALQSFHFARSYTDVGYHFVVFPSGRIYEGRPSSAAGAHCLGANDELGFSFAGNYEKETPSPAALEAFERWKTETGITTVRGHFRVPGNATACPGRHLKAALAL